MANPCVILKSLLGPLGIQIGRLLILETETPISSEPTKLDRHRISSLTLTKAGAREAHARSPDWGYICHRLSRKM